MDLENQLIIQTKSENNTYIPKLLPHRDSAKQVLTRSRYPLYKSVDKWTQSQKERTQMIFELYPDIKIAYNLN